MTTIESARAFLAAHPMTRRQALVLNGYVDVRGIVDTREVVAELIAAYVAPSSLIRTERCAECGGKGWHIGDCHPQETCGACSGTGRIPVADVGEVQP